MSIDLTGVRHEAPLPLRVHSFESIASVAVLPGAIVLACDPEFFVGHCFQVHPAASILVGVVNLPVATLSPPHPRAVLPDPFVVASAVVFRPVVRPVVRLDIALPGLPVVASDPVFTPGPVVPVDPAASLVVAEIELLVASISPPAPRAILPDPIVIAGVVVFLPVVIPGAIALLPGSPVVASDPVFTRGPVVPVDPAAFCIPELLRARGSPGLLRALLPLPIVIATDLPVVLPVALPVIFPGAHSGIPGEVVVEGDRDGVFEVILEATFLGSVSHRGNKSESKLHRYFLRRYSLRFYLLLNSDFPGLLSYFCVTNHFYFIYWDIRAIWQELKRSETTSITHT